MALQTSQKPLATTTKGHQSLPLPTRQPLSFFLPGHLSLPTLKQQTTTIAIGYRESESEATTGIMPNTTANASVIPFSRSTPSRLQHFCWVFLIYSVRVLYDFGIWEQAQ